MAESTGKDTPTNGPKATGKSGAVKPPVLEGTAKPASSATPSEQTAAEKPATAAPRPTPHVTPKPEANMGSSGKSLVAGLLGGAVGLGAAYGLAWFGLWPTPEQAPPQVDPRIAGIASAIPELQTVTNTVQDELSALNGRVSTLEASPHADSAETTSAITALASRIDALDQAATSVTATSSENIGNAEDIAALRTELDAIRAKTDALSAELSKTGADLAALQDATPVNTPELTRLPLVFSALESAFATGRPFDTELSVLRQSLPDILVPEILSGQAAKGLPDPAQVEQALAQALPAILAGRPANPDASWQDATMDWFRGIVAMRPAGAMEGGSPEAIVSRIEAAVAQADFATAASELESLPQPMRDAAGPVATDIATLAAAQSFVTELRTQVLTMETGV
jgi:hypothetical protein